MLLCDLNTSNHVFNYTNRDRSCYNHNVIRISVNLIKLYIIVVSKLLLLIRIHVLTNQS